MEVNWAAARVVQYLQAVSLLVAVSIVRLAEGEKKERRLREAEGKPMEEMSPWCSSSSIEEVRKQLCQWQVRTLRRVQSKECVPLLRSFRGAWLGALTPSSP
jgi:hypothetical protein